ncbi:MAG: acyltransferase, partial [Rhodospirillales bacterium]|nr:acyltransferase [Acetobacter sp.]
MREAHSTACEAEGSKSAFTSDAGAIVVESSPAGEPAKKGSARTAYLPQLDGLRALAVLMVFLHHAYKIPLLWSGVDLFFILSGYLITNILLRDSARMPFRSMLGHFYLRRAQRILPAYG